MFSAGFFYLRSGAHSLTNLKNSVVEVKRVCVVFKSCILARYTILASYRPANLACKTVPSKGGWHLKQVDEGWIISLKRPHKELECSVELVTAPTDWDTCV